jgi:tRNA-uridine 2-sulfurtransferase
MKDPTVKKKALALMSGGLDSTLSTRWALEQDQLDVEAVHFKHSYCSCPGVGCKETTATARGKVSDMKTKTIYLGDEYLKMLKKPKHGYGANMNPCIDCRIMMFKKAAEYMKESGADFLITGEVLGERAMSQRKDAMHLIDNEAGLKGKVLRPLSGKLMPATDVEKEGVIKRESLMDIQGRSRKPQMRMAEEKQITSYPTPAGGCLLTDPGFSRKLKDLFYHEPDCTQPEVNLLKVGRHLRLSPKFKLVVGRNHTENQKLHILARPGDYLVQVGDTKGGLCVARGEGLTEDLKTLICRIAAHYSQYRAKDSVEVSWRTLPGDETEQIFTSPFPEKEIDPFRI